MAHVLIMPRQGNTVESCIIVQWKVKEGDSVKADTVVCEVETDKATFEVPAGESGTVLRLIRAGGDDVPVLEPIAVIGKAGEDWSAAAGSTAAAQAAPEARSAPVSAAVVTNASTIETAVFQGAISPRARNLAEKEGLQAADLTGTGPGGRIIERDVKTVLDGRPPLTAAARAMAPAGGMIPASGSGLGGRATAADLGGGTAAIVTTAALAELPGPAQGEGAVTDTPVKGIRKLIADRMYQSLAESAQFTLNASAPAVRLQELRGRMKAADESLGLNKITANDLILYAVSRMLPKYPFMNAHKIGDTLRTFERIHLGVAVDTPRGLMVPVIRNASLLSLRQISAEAKRLAAVCQNGGAKPDELSGSTFTVTNLGSLGVSSFTPVLNTPEVAILGVCGIDLRPVQADDCGEIHFEPHIGFSLTINHQAVDGAPAARFLKALGEAVANIDLLLAGG
jgi:pyruvate dehydrogenase E2 component (dihydrolipoamide acetyltransferase)